MQTVNCFCCQKEMQYEEEENHSLNLLPLYKGLWFRSSGNYGSSIFDPNDERYFQIAICDLCLLDKTQSIQLIKDISYEVSCTIEPLQGGIS